MKPQQGVGFARFSQFQDESSAGSSYRYTRRQYIVAVPVRFTFSKECTLNEWRLLQPRTGSSVLDGPFKIIPELTGRWAIAT